MERLRFLMDTPQFDRVSIQLFDYVTDLYKTQTLFINSKIKVFQANIKRLKDELDGYEKSKSSGNLCDIIEGVGGKKDRCRGIRESEIPEYEGYVKYANDVLTILQDDRQRWVDLLRDGPLNFAYDFNITFFELLPALYRTPVSTTVPSELLDTLASIYSVKKPDGITGITEKNMAETMNVDSITRRLWLSSPSKLEEYIYVSPIDFKAYMRNAAPPSIRRTADDVRLLAESIALGPPPTGSDYIRAKGGLRELGAAKASVGWSTKSRAMPIFKQRNDNGNITYDLDQEAIGYNSVVCSTEITDELMAYIPVPAQNFVAQYIQSRIRRVKQYVLQANPDYKAVVPQITAYFKDISTTGDDGKEKAANKPDRAKNTYTADQMVKDYLPNGTAEQKKLLTTMFTNKTTEVYDLSGTPLLKAKSYFDIYSANRNSLFDQVAQGYYDLGDGSKTMTMIYDIFPVGETALDVRFTATRHANPAQIQGEMDALKADYMKRLASNPSQEEYDNATSAYQNAYQTLKDRQNENTKDISGGTTARLFYTRTADVIRITGILEDNILENKIYARSFYSSYTGGLYTTNDDSQGRVNYSPNMNYYKNSAPPLDCKDPVTLRQIGTDYALALAAGDLSGAAATLSNPWDDTSGNLFVTKIIGSQQLNPRQCAIQWEETTFDSATNKAGPPTVRNVKVSYAPNTSEWYANELLFDASGFQYYLGPKGDKCSFTADKATYNILYDSPCPKTDPNARFDVQTYSIINPTVTAELNRNIPLLIDRYKKTLAGDISPAWNILPFATPMPIQKPYPTNVNLDNAQGTCPTLTCLDPEIMYTLIDTYNITEDYPGVILRVIKCVTMNEGQCDVLVDMDYTKPKGSTDAPKEKAGKVLREQVSLYVSLDLASCKYSLLDSAPGFGVQDNTPLRTDASGVVKPFDYVYNFAVNTFTPIAASANKLIDQVSSAYNTATKVLSDYRALTFANIGDIETFRGCPDIRCRNLDIMTAMMKQYDKDNIGVSRMGRILRLGTSIDIPNACDVTFETDSVIFDKPSGRTRRVPSSTAAMRFQFGPRTTSTYDAIFAKRIADAVAKGQPTASIEAERAEMNDQVGCAFKVASTRVILPSAPTWAETRDISSNRVSVVNPLKGEVRFVNPFPDQSVSATDPKTMNLIREASLQMRASAGYTVISTGTNTFTATPVEINSATTPKMIRRIINTDPLTCAVELDVTYGASDTATVYRQYKFMTEDGLSYKIIEGGIVTPSDISGSGVYVGLVKTGDAYTFTSAPTPILQDIVEPLPLRVDPNCRTAFTAAGVMAYNGYEAPLDSFKRDESTFEIRITNNEYYSFGETFKLVKIYTDSACNPRIDTITDAPPNGSRFAVPLDNLGDPRYYRALQDYFARYATYVSDLRPRKRLGQVWRAGTDFETGLIHFEVTMGEYDADDNVMNFYGWPQDAVGPWILPRAVLACDFRRRFNKPEEIYLANTYVLMNTSTVLDATKAPAGQTITSLPDPLAFSSYKYLEFVPLAARSGSRAQIQRVEFYSGNERLSISNGTYSISATGETINGDVRKSIRGDASGVLAEMFYTDGSTITPDMNAVFEVPVGTAIVAKSPASLSVTALSFMSGMNPACDVVSWKLRGSGNGKFWKEIVPPTQVTYPAYGYWRIPITPGGAPLNQNPKRPKGFVECEATISTDTVKRLSALVYDQLSRTIFGAKFEDAQKNIKRAYLTGLPQIQVDDYNNVIYLKGDVQTFDENYNLSAVAGTAVYFTLTYARSTTCTFNYNISLTGAPKNWAPVELTLKLDAPPFAWGGYPSALVKYTDTLGQTFETPAGLLENTTTITSFISYGPDRPAPVTLPKPLTKFSNLGLEGASQMCADNAACIGFSWLNNAGSFFTDPNDNTSLVTDVTQQKTYFKNGYSLTTYARITGLTSANGVSLAKLGFYKGNKLLNVSTGALYTIDSKGEQTGAQTFGSMVANLFDYSSTGGWSSDNTVDGIHIQFNRPIIITGYTLVTNNPATAPKSWSLSVSMDGVNWKVVDRRTVTPPTTEYTAYPLFQIGGQTGVSTDFSIKTFGSCGYSCSSPSNLELMIGLYRQQRVTMANSFQVRSVGRDMATDQCIIAWANDVDETVHTTGFKFAPTYGPCADLLDTKNITMTSEPPTTNATMTSIKVDGPYRLFRFKPLLLNGGRGTCLAGIYFLSGGKRLEPASCINPANNDIPSGTSQQVIDSYLNDWVCQTLGALIIGFDRPTPVDSYTLFSGSKLSQAPKRWTLEGSIDGTIWTMLHDQSASDARVPTQATTQYQIFSLNPAVAPVDARSILEKSLADFNIMCDDASILGKVNDAAAAETPSIFFNPTKFTLNTVTNQCTYLQANGNLLEANLSVTVAGTVSVLSVKSLAGPLIGAATTVGAGKLVGINDCNTDCKDDALVQALDSFYKNTSINTTKGPLAATKYGSNTEKNECLFELDSMYAPLDNDNKPINRIGFQFQKETGCKVSPRIIGVDTNVTDSLTTPTLSGPYKFIRFKVTATKGDGPVEISAFNFFKGGVEKTGMSMVLTNPGGNNPGTIDLTNGWRDPNMKPLQFSSTEPIDFDGYSWTTSKRTVIGATSASDPVAWTIQVSKNGILWTTLDTRTTPIRLPDSVIQYKMPIYGLDGSVTERQPIPTAAIAAPKVSLNCRALWPDALVAYMEEIQPSASPSVPTKFGYDEANNQCNYKFVDQDYGTVYAGFKFESGKVTAITINDDPRSAAGISTPIDF